MCASKRSPAQSRTASKGVAALDHSHAFGDQPLELDRADFRAVLLGLAALLLVLVAIELASNLRRGAVEQVDRRPQEVLEVGFKAGV